MTGDQTTVPENVQRFEVLLYLSLMLDALSFPFREMPAKLSESEVLTTNLISAGLILVFVHMVRLAARRRKNWARWVLLGALALSVVSLAAVVGVEGWETDSVVDAVSSALTAVGLYYSFTGDARDWFNA
ncbi:MAG: hypothetical protein J0G95_02165 [Rhizobiales bacterium]|nr:hypothetical protein [Hyphomicrobiales bacterium]